MLKVQMKVRVVCTKHWLQNIMEYLKVWKGHTNLWKAAFGGGEFNYRPELNAIKEKLELLIVTDNDKDPLFNFKVMYEDDLESLKKLFPMLKIERHQNQQNYSCIKM